MPHLLDGTEVSPDHPAWIAESEARERHLATLARYRTRDERAEYLEALERAEGGAQAERVRRMFEYRWETARAQK